MKVALRFVVRFVSALAAVCLSSVLYGQTTPAASLLVLSKHDHTLSIVDPSTLQVVARMPVGNDPHEVIASTDGTTAYVSNYGSGAYNTLAVIDLVGRRALPSINLGPLRGPHGLAFVGGRTWFTAEAAKAIGRYDPATQKVDWILGTGQNRTHMIYVSDDQQRIITTNVSSGTVSIIEMQPIRMPGPPPGGMGPPPGAGRPQTSTQTSTQTAATQTGAIQTGSTQTGSGGPPPGSPRPHMDWNETVVRVGNGSEGFDVSPDHRELWVANAQDSTISVIDIAANKVVQTIQANVRGANRLKFTPDGKHVLVSTLGGPDLVVFDTATRRQIKRIPVGHGAAGIMIEPEGARAFVACTPDNYVAVIDLRSFAVAGHIQAGGEPDGMAWAIRH
jgi:YVTN family beta-propeller protein